MEANKQETAKPTIKRQLDQPMIYKSALEKALYDALQWSLGQIKSNRDKH
ncbi:MAG: hypothetical protein KDD94_05035 [Calditrichaeota bacterium]|nr:hypothetical protein [Calditrichota bacterium]